MPPTAARPGARPAGGRALRPAGGPAVRPAGGPSWRVTGLVSVLAFVSVCNTITFLARGLTSSHAHLTAARLGIQLGISVALTAWAARRVRAERGHRSDSTVHIAAAGLPGEEDAGAAWGSWSDRLPGWLARALRYARWALGLGLFAAAALTIAGQWSTLASAVDQLGDLKWRWLQWAVYAEAFSIVIYASLMLVLLRAGGVRLRLRPILSLTLAGNALVVSVPGGVAWAATFSFDQLRRRGVPRGLAVAVPILSSAFSALALFFVLVVGVDLAGGTGPTAAFDSAALAVTGGVLAALVAAPVLRRRAKLPNAVGRRLDAAGVRLSPRLLAAGLVPALLNWVFDCGCLAASIIALSGHVPWQGLLVAYAVAQIGANLPITPGGIGVVEGAMTVLLVAYGMHSSTAVAAVLLYRIISFWALVPLGWMLFAAAVARRRTGRVQAVPVVGVSPVVPVTAPRPAAV